MKIKIGGKYIGMTPQPGASAAFSRPSTAYLPDGTAVASGEPRYYGGGILLEEGLTNEHPNPSVENDLTKWSANYHCTLTRDNTRAWHGTWSGKFVVTAPGGNFYGDTASDGAGGIPCLGGQARTHSFYIWAQPGNVGTAKIEVNQFGADGTHISGSGVASVFSSIQGQWERLSVSFTTHAEARFLSLRIRGHNDCVEGDTFWVDGCMSIPLSYGLSFHEATRAIELLTVPTPAGLTPAAGTIEVDVEINALARRQVAGQYPEIIMIPRADGNDGIRLRHSPAAAEWRFLSYADDGSNTMSDAIPDALLPDGVHRLRVDWNSSAVRLYIDDNPTPAATINAPKLPSAFGANIAIGGRTANTMANTWFYGCRLSSIARGAAGLSGPEISMPVDSNTLGCWVFNNTLSSVIGMVYGAYITGSIVIEKQLGVRNTCSFTVWHTDQEIQYQKGNPFEIYNDEDDLIFAGFIETVKMTREGDWFLHELTGIDYRYLADKRLAIYSKLNATAGTIAQELFDAYLSVEGCTVGEIQDGLEISETVFNYISLASALDRLADSVGYFWYIDNQKRFYFINKSANAAPWTLTYLDVNGTPQIEKGNLKYRNTQYVLGAKNITSTQTAIRRGDGVNRMFIVDYPIASKPVIEISLSGGPYVAIDPGDVGIKGVDEDKKWYWNKNQKEISQADTETVLTVDDYVKIIYQGFEEVLIKLSDNVAIAAMQAAEGFGSGIVEDAIQRADITSIEAGYDAADAELVKNGQIGDRIVFQTVRAGLEPGQMLPVNLPRYDLNADFLIESVVIQEEVKGIVWYEITASRGTMYEAWVKMFSKMLTTEVLILRENMSEFLRLLFDFYKTWAEEDAPNIFAEVYPADDLYPANDLYPMFDPSDRVKYIEAFDALGISLGRKYLASQSGTTNLKTRFYISELECNGDIVELAWYGGINAAAESESGVEIDRQAFARTKTFLDALQIQRQDIKGW